MMYQRGIRWGRPLGPIVAHVTTRSPARNRASSSSDIRISSRREGTALATSGQRRATVSRRRAERMWVWGPCRGPRNLRQARDRGAPRLCRGVPSVGGWGAMSGPPTFLIGAPMSDDHLRAIPRCATASPGRTAPPWELGGHVEAPMSKIDQLGDPLAMIRGVPERELRRLRALEVEVQVVLPRETDAAVKLDARAGRLAERL